MELDPLGVPSRYRQGDAEILGFYLVLSEGPDIVPEAAATLLRFEDDAEMGGASSLHVARAPALESHWPGALILRGLHPATQPEGPEVMSLVAVVDGQPRRVVAWSHTRDGWQEFLALFEGAQLGEDADEVALALGALLQPMVEPGSAHPGPLAVRAVAGGLDVVLSASAEGSVVLSLGLDDGQLVGLTLAHRSLRPEPASVR